MASPFQYWASFLVCLAIVCTVHAQDEAFDEIVAVVDAEIVTWSDVKWLIGFRGFPVPEEESEQARFYLEIVEQIVNQVLILRETIKTPFIAANEEEIFAFLEQHEARFSADDEYKNALQKMGLTTNVMTDILRRQVTVNKFIELRFEPFVIVLPDEIDEYYQTEYVPELRASNQYVPPVSLVEETIRQILSVRKTTEYLERWLRDARQAAEVQIHFGKADTGPNLPADLRRGLDTQSISKLPDQNR
jgi:hypothetical protein